MHEHLPQTGWHYSAQRCGTIIAGSRHSIEPCLDSDRIPSHRTPNVSLGICRHHSDMSAEMVCCHDQPLNGCAPPDYAIRLECIGILLGCPRRFLPLTLHTDLQAGGRQQQVSLFCKSLCIVTGAPIMRHEAKQNRCQSTSTNKSIAHTLLLGQPEAARGLRNKLLLLCHDSP